MASIDIDWDDFLHDCSSYEKQKIIDSLYDEGYSPTDLNSEELVMEAESNGEVELVKTLQNIWKNRMFLNSNDLDSLNHYANKGLYEN